MNTEKKHGGKRSGAGRPPQNDKPGKRTNVYLSEEEIALLKKMGKGSVSAGIHRLVNLAKGSTVE